MTWNRYAVLATAFTVAFFAVGWSYWFIPYQKVSLPDSLYGFGLLAVAASAVASRVVPTIRLWTATWATGASVPCAVMARVIYDVSSDPTSHNLWPFEIVLAAGPGFLLALVGGLLGGWLMPVLHRDH